MCAVENLSMLIENTKIFITINYKEYEISTHFSINDSEKYIEELSKENDYKKAISIILYDKLKQDNVDECPSLKDIMDTKDSAFTDYVFAVVSTSKELQIIFNEMDRSFAITKRFGIAYKSYMDLLGKRMADALRPVIDNYNRMIKSIDLSWVGKMQEIANRFRPAWIDSLENMTHSVQQIANAVQPFRQLAASISSTIANINIPTISKEKIEQWEVSYKKWGEIGWPVLPNASFNFFNGFPENAKSAHKIAMRYCNTKSMDELFDSLRNQHIKATDLESAIFCYKNRQYKACSLMIFCLLDSKMIKIQPKSNNRAVGLSAVKKLKSQLDENNSQEYFLLITGLYQINLMTCLDIYFAKGNGFIKEPATINRNFIDHGMNTRRVRKRDCIQLFLALHNLLGFLEYISS